jgi:hypothetical protein
MPGFFVFRARLKFFLGGRCQPVSMIKGIVNATVGLSIAALLDRKFDGGQHIEAALAILQHIRHSMGL